MLQRSPMFAVKYSLDKDDDEIIFSAALLCD